MHERAVLRGRGLDLYGRHAPAVDTPINLPGDQYVPSYCAAPSGPDAMIADRTPNGAPSPEQAGARG